MPLSWLCEPQGVTNGYRVWGDRMGQRVARVVTRSNRCTAEAWDAQACNWVYVAAFSGLDARERAIAAAESIDTEYYNAQCADPRAALARARGEA